MHQSTYHTASIRNNACTPAVEQSSKRSQIDDRPCPLREASARRLEHKNCDLRFASLSVPLLFRQLLKFRRKKHSRIVTEYRASEFPLHRNDSASTPHVSAIRLARLSHAAHRGNLRNDLDSLAFELRYSR